MEKDPLKELDKCSISLKRLKQLAKLESDAMKILKSERGYAFLSFMLSNIDEKIIKNEIKYTKTIIDINIERDWENE